MFNLEQITKLYQTLHQMPEPGFEEVKTSAFLAQRLQDAGYEVQTKVGGTGVVGILRSKKTGQVVALRADMDALRHVVNGKVCAIHSCGHDAHSTMVLTVAEEVAKRGLASGTLKIIFQPAEELLFGALRVIEDGAIDDVDILLGMHLRPAQEAIRGQATPALCHGASKMIEATLTGRPAHGARPHLGINAIDAAAAVVNAINAIQSNPVIPTSIKTTKLQAGGPALNAIPDKALMAFDLRTQENAAMEELVQKARRAIEGAAASVGATASINILGGVPAAEYTPEIVTLAQAAIVHVLGTEGLLPATITPGGEDFHFYIKHKPTLKVGYLGLGCNLLPGLHHPDMKFDVAALPDGINILLYMVDKLIGIKAE